MNKWEKRLRKLREHPRPVRLVARVPMRPLDDLLLEEGFVFIRWVAGRPTVTKTPYFTSLAKDSLPATGYNLIAVRPDAVDEMLALLTKAGWAPN